METTQQPSTKEVPSQILQYRREILDEIERNNITIIQGETGCGKSSMIPLFLYQEAESKGHDVNIIITQPRRIAAQTLAKRLAFLLDCGVGDLVGYQISMDSAVSLQTRISYATTGYLLQLLMGQEHFFQKLTHIILDEVHERDIDHDLLCLIIKLQIARYPSLKIIIMSATLQYTLYESYFSSCKVSISQPIHVGNKRYPLTEYTLDNIPTSTLFAGVPRLVTACRGMQKIFEDQEHILSPSQLFGSSTHYRNYTQLKNEIILELLVWISSQPDQEKRSTLIFLPGLNQIEDSVSFIKSHYFRFKDPLETIILHSFSPDTEKEKALQAPRPGCMKVVFSTNVAESSITIPDISYVINDGIRKQIRFDDIMQMTRLESVWCSQASCHQRAGRVGRTHEGMVFHLLPYWMLSRVMQPHDPSEISRVNIETHILRMKLRLERFGAIDVLLSQLLEPPSKHAVQHALLQLYRHGALTAPSAEGSITRLGMFYLDMPVGPQLAKLIYVSLLFRIPCDGIFLAAILSSSDPFNQHLDSGSMPFEEYCRIIRHNYLQRLKYDEGSYSEPIGALNLIKEFLYRQSVDEFTQETDTSLIRIRNTIFRARHILESVSQYLGKSMMKQYLLDVGEQVSSLQSDINNIMSGDRRHSEKVLDYFVDDTSILKDVLMASFSDNACIGTSVTNGKSYMRSIQRSGLDITNAVLLRFKPLHQLEWSFIQYIFASVAPFATLINHEKGIVIQFPSDVGTWTTNPEAYIQDLCTELKIFLQILDKNEELFLKVPHGCRLPSSLPTKMGMWGELLLNAGRALVCNYSPVWKPFSSGLQSLQTEKRSVVHSAVDLGDPKPKVAVCQQILASSGGQEAHAAWMTVMNRDTAVLSLLMYGHLSNSRLLMDVSQQCAYAAQVNGVMLDFSPCVLPMSLIIQIIQYRESFCKSFTNGRTLSSLDLYGLHKELQDAFLSTQFQEIQSLHELYWVPIKLQDEKLSLGPFSLDTSRLESLSHSLGKHPKNKQQSPTHQDGAAESHLDEIQFVQQMSNLIFDDKKASKLDPDCQNGAKKVPLFTLRCIPGATELANLFSQWGMKQVALYQERDRRTKVYTISVEIQELAIDLEIQHKKKDIARSECVAALWSYVDHLQEGTYYYSEGPETPVTIIPTLVRLKRKDESQSSERSSSARPDQDAFCDPSKQLINCLPTNGVYKFDDLEFLHPPLSEVAAKIVEIIEHQDLVVPTIEIRRLNPCLVTIITRHSYSKTPLISFGVPDKVMAIALNCLLEVFSNSHLVRAPIPNKVHTVVLSLKNVNLVDQERSMGPSTSEGPSESGFDSD
eukprot:TRINITY_DN9042_c0_g2_i2.p1 TRINITY_DN9042_c0_g2~~TRINITY_DN9042_c0_g2_i2.p1  ORF type:complete len:1319 (+),score=222.34 TRINITY_DN9042_c0_g2_i2:61-4017(+)